MNWPHIFGSNYGPEIPFGSYSHSFLLNPQLGDSGTQFLQPTLRRKTRLYSTTNGYDSRVVVPKDKRYQNQTVKAYHGTDKAPESYSFEQAYVPYEIGSAHDSVSRIISSDDFFDPTITNIMDVTQANYNLEYPRPDCLQCGPQHMIAYVTGNERTNVAVSLLSNDIIHTPQTQTKEPANIYDIVPNLSPAYIYHTKNPINQLNFTQASGQSFRNVCLVRSMNKVDILKPSYFYDSIDESQFLARPVFEPLYSVKLSQTRSDTEICPENVSYVSLNSSIDKLAAIKSRGSLSLYSISKEDGHYGSSHISKQSLDPFLSGASHSPWHRLFWVDEKNLFVANRRGIDLYDIRLRNYTKPEALFNFRNNRLGSSFLSDLVQSPTNPYQAFGVIESHVVWLDARYPKKPILSLQHNLLSDDPSIKINAVAMDPRYGADKNDNITIKDQMMITLSSALTPATLVYEVGTNESGLSFLLSDPYTYNLHPEYNTQSLSTIPQYLKSTSEEHGKEEKMVCTVFQQSQDYGLVQHLLSSDPLDTLDLSQKYNPYIVSNGQKVEYHDSLIRLTRGLAKSENNDDSAGADIKDFRPFFRLICDLDKCLPKDTDSTDPNQDVVDTIIEKLKDLLENHERGVFTLIDLVERSQLYKNAKIDIPYIIQQVESEFGNKIKCKSRISRIRSLLYNSEVTQIQDLEQFFSKLWIEPLKGAPVSLQMQKITTKNAKTLKELRARKRQKHRVGNVIIKDNTDSQTIKKIIRVPKRGHQKVIITPRSINYKHSTYKYDRDFVTRRQKIIDIIIADILLSHVNVSVRNNLKDEKFLDKDLGVLRKYTDKFDNVVLSEETQSVLDIWKVKDRVVIKPPGDMSYTESGGLKGKQSKSSKKKSGRKAHSSQSQSYSQHGFSQSQGQSQGYSQSYSQSYMGSQSQSSQNRKKKRKLKEGFM